MKLKSLIKFLKDEILVPCVIGCTIAIIVNNFIGFTFVNGSSMYPTLEDRNYLMLNKIGASDVEKGEIIVFDTTPDAKRKDKIFYIKRVIATEGDHVEITGGEVRVNGKTLNEKYTDGSITEGDINAIVPEGKCFVLGDNRDGSTDSRVFGFVSEEDVVGTVVTRIFPFKKIEYK